MFVNFGTTLFAAIFNVLTFIKFLLIQKQNNAALNVNERNLLLVSLTIFIAQLLRCSYNLGRLFDGSDPVKITFLVSILPYLNDIFAWSGSISLMVLSSTTRKTYTLFYTGKMDSQANVIILPKCLN
uniref:Serpentine receptor class gamma n=1 Tax=Panagrolaimus sp. PS1159 TaxID=55785 RepID=A0AC35GAU0_9BILA